MWLIAPFWGFSQQIYTNSILWLQVSTKQTTAFSRCSSALKCGQQRFNRTFVQLIFNVYHCRFVLLRKNNWLKHTNKRKAGKQIYGFWCLRVLYPEKQLTNGECLVTLWSSWVCPDRCRCRWDEHMCPISSIFSSPFPSFCDVGLALNACLDCGAW